MKRAVFYLFYDAQGVVDEYVPYMLAALRPHADHIFVVSNSALTPSGRDALEAVADTVYVRPNVGFDVWGYKDALETFGRERLAEYDEIILMNYTVFGPVFPFEELFARAEALDVDFWGVTAHGALDPNPYAVAAVPVQDVAVIPEVLPAHIQSHWIAARSRLLCSTEWQRYWDEMPMITSYESSILNHESRFTQHFARQGFRHEVLFPNSDFPDPHPIFENFDMMLDARCPLVKRRIFFHEPTYLDRNAIVARRLVERLASDTDYPVDLVWRNVVRTAEPRTLYTNTSSLEILPDGEATRSETPLRLAVLAHLFYEDMVEEVMAHLDRVPFAYDLYVTTSTAARRAAIETALAERGVNAEVRVTEQNRGRDMSSLFITFRDVLTSGRHDLALRLHSKRSPQNGRNQAQLFKAHLFDNLLSSPRYVQEIVALFEREATLGMVFPPVVSIGFPTLGHSWFTNRPAAQMWASRMGIHTAFDRSTPIAPYGTMFWFRPEALRDIVEYPWSWSDYPKEPGHQDGGLAHVQERLLGYAAMNAGYHVRTVMNPWWAAVNYTFLEYRLQRLSAMLPEAYPQEQVDYIQRMTEGTLLGYMKFGIAARSPRLAGLLRLPYRAARRLYRGASAARRRVQGGGR